MSAWSTGPKYVHSLTNADRTCPTWIGQSHPRTEGQVISQGIYAEGNVEAFHKEIVYLLDNYIDAFSDFRPRR
jgi:hypothetical protein